MRGPHSAHVRRHVPYAAIWIGAIVLLAFVILIFVVLHSHGFAHFVAHIPAVDWLVHKLGYRQVRGVYSHLRHLIP